MEKTNKLLLLALGFGLVFHGSALFFTLEETYDALVHTFFADHYLHQWFDAWEPRWYTGFTVQGYPPLVHQLIALFAMVGGLKFGLFTVAFLAIVLFITGMFRFTRMLTGNSQIAGVAALLATCSSAFVETLHLFGQLPSIFGLSLLMHALPEIYAWVRFGRRQELLKALALIGVTVCSHHVTPIFGMVFFIFPTLGMVLMDHAAEAAGGLPKVRLGAFLRAFRALFWRIVSFGFSTLAIIVLFILPYWLNTKKNPITQVPIPHGSRDHFIEVSSSGLVFFLIPWGVMLLFLPYIFYRFFSKRYLFFGLSLAMLTLLGTGGTTPIPRMLLGESAFNILTLDRFTLWASIMSLPLLAELCYRYLVGDLRTVWVARFGTMYHRLIGAAFFAVLLFMTVFSLSLGYFRPAQPQQIKMLPIVNFLNQDMHDHWRYLTLGFGDQMAWLSTQTQAMSVDGNYHSARRLPELTTRAVERLENSKFRGIEGLGSLQQFLTVPEKYHLKFIFSNDKFYDPLLFYCGWRRLQQLENGIMVWERNGVPPLPEILPRPAPARWLNLWWGVVPLSSALLAFLVCIQWPLMRPIFRPRAGLPKPLMPTTVYNGMRAPMVLISQSWGWGVAVLVLFLVFSFYKGQQPQDTPEKVLKAYYDALDFKEFEQAYAYLDAGEHYSLDQYLLELSVGDGLLSSYAKLEAIRLHAVAMEGNTATAKISTHWITPLEETDRVTVHKLIKKDGRWYIVPEPRDPDLPPDQLVIQPEVTFFNHGRRRITTQQTYHEDVLRRPETRITGERCVEWDGTYWVIGWVHNVDAFPADVAVTAALRTSSGEPLARYNAGQTLKHNLLPGEASPFRVAFEETAWLGQDTQKPATFNPGESHSVTFASPPDAFLVRSEANLSTSDLYNQLELEIGQPEAGQIPLMVHNYGIQEATIVQFLISYFDQEGQLLWVDQQYLDRSVRVQRRQSYQLRLPDLTGVRPVRAHNQSEQRDAASIQTPGPGQWIALEGKGFSSIHIKLNAYVGAPR